MRKTANSGVPVQKVNYPKEYMHRISYTKLTEQQILDKLRAATAGPVSASPLSDALAGRTLRIVTDSGPTLAYRFTASNRLSLSENGDDAVETGYGALTLGRVVFFSHLVPGTQRGYHVVVDQESSLATVFDTWFSGFEDNREVQREIFHGYVEQDGQAPPSVRHGITNRVEGNGFYWKQDNGVETLEFFPSVFYSNFVDLTRFGGELSYCAPSDYVKITDTLYTYARVEAEFSGILTLYVFDLNRAEQVGVRLGFDESDTLEYYVFNGRGESVGQLAVFSPFDDKGETVPLGNRQIPQQRGGRPVYRPMRSNWTMTRAEVDTAVAANRNAFVQDSAMAGNKMPVSELLAGKEMTLRFDRGPVIEYQVEDMRTLRWRREGERGWNQERYEAWESTPGVVMFGHFLSGAPEHDCMKIVADFDRGLVSCVNGTMGTPYIANESAAKTFFGVIETDGINPPKYHRHEFTTDLVGSALTWNYSPGLTSMHLYSTPHSLSWIIFLENGAVGMEWSGPASYVKIRDDLYLVYWLEEACNGVLGTILVNKRTMHDCGIGYSCRPNGLSLSSIGAHSRNAGKFDIMKYFARADV
jgi:hypothetical protein